MALDHFEEDYIDMEMNSFSNLFSKNSMNIFSSSPPYSSNNTTTTNNNNSNPREFEFQMCSSTRDDKDQPTTSPADELFYKGKLLPLHLPPRLQMVEKLLESSIINDLNFSYSSSFDHLNHNVHENGANNFDQDFFSTPLMTTPPTPTASSTPPFESCNVSPSESFRVSPDEEEYAYNEEIVSSVKLLAKRLNKQPSSSSLLGSKLKASRAFLKSLFGRSGCSSESSTAARRVSAQASAKSNHFGKHNCQAPQNTKEIITTAAEGCGGRRHRRSFSLSLRRHSTVNKSTSSSSSSGSSSFSWSSSNSNGRDQLKYLKRCGSAKYSEAESSIQGAIAHCKQSHQHFLSSRNSVSGSRIGDEHEREELFFRG